jgi:hypothetical protein
VKGFCVLVLALAVPFSAAAADRPERSLEALRRALASQATWTMSRRLAESRRPLVSTGIVSCVVGEGIEWRVLYPFASSVSLTTNAMVFADEDGKRVKPLADLPHYKEIQRRTDAFARGDRSAFDGFFDLAAQESPDGTWQLTLTPCVRAFRRLLRSVRLSGDTLPREAQLTNGDGSVSTIRFGELPRAH